LKRRAYNLSVTVARTVLFNVRYAGKYPPMVVHDNDTLIRRAERYGRRA